MPDTLQRRRFDMPVDTARVAADWQARGYSCHAFVDPPGRTWEDFSHATNELVTVSEGRLEVEVDGRREILEPGDECFIPRQARHSVRNRHAGTTRWLFGYD